ncbi:MAG: transposase [Mesorhizobium sp.]|nr:MAG: transposase [Mesorhizobium sp.]TIL47977.1 MAG: transposase [Mesorhizobium sp.]
MPSRRRQQGWILPALAAVGAAAGRNWSARCIQRLALANRHYGYRRIGALLGREGWQVNHKRVLRVMGEDNLLCLRTRHSCRALQLPGTAGGWCRTLPEEWN